MSFSYPQFRKNTSEKSYYQITSSVAFVEWQRLGTRWIHHEVEATILPEKLLIADLLSCENGHYLVIDEAEFRHATEQ